MSARSQIIRALIVAAAYFVILQSIDGAAIRPRRRKGGNSSDTSANSTVSLKPDVQPQLLPPADNKTSIEQLPLKNAVIAQEGNEDKPGFQIEANNIQNEADRVPNGAAGIQIDDFKIKTKVEKDQNKNNNALIESDSNDQFGAGDGQGEAENIQNDAVKDKFWASLNKSRSQRERSAEKEPLILRHKPDEKEDKKHQPEMVVFSNCY